MNVFKSLFALATAALIFSGCSTTSQTANLGVDSEKVAQAVSLSEKWDSEFSNAIAVVEDLRDSGLCQRVATAEDGVFGGDSLAQYEAGSFAICYNWASSQDPYDLDCATTFYISTGEAMAGYDPKRSLYYEDGASVALFYGTNYEVELSPVNGGYLSGEELLAACDAIVSHGKTAISGLRTMIDQYESDFMNEESNEVEQPVSNLVTMPNLLGSLDGAAKNWLIAQGYDFSVRIASTGFNPKTSCMMSGKNPILQQAPAPGTSVTNDYATQVVLTVNCEW